MSNHALIYTGLGAVIGFILGGFIVGSMCGKEYRKRIESLQAQNDRLTVENRENREQGLLKREEALKDKYEKAVEALHEYHGDEEPDEDEAEDEGIGEFDADTDVEFNDPFGGFSESDIYLIDAKEFQGDVDYRDNETLTYYQADGVLVDMQNDIVDNPERVVGKDLLEKAADTDEEFLYVSNDIDDKMYEVIIEKNESFYRDIAR